MKSRSSAFHVLPFAALLLLGACNPEENPPLTGTAGTSATGGAGTGAAGHGGGAGTTGAAGTGNGAAGTGNGAAGTGNGAAGTGAAGTGTAGKGAAGTGAAGTGAAGTGAANGDQPPPHPLNVVPGGKSKVGNLRIDKSKPALGKLILLLGGICGGPGAGGIESFVEAYGFHIFSPGTQTCVDGGNNDHKKYRDMLTDNDPSNDAEANRIVGDARMELWDGVDRVPFVTVAKGQSIVEQTVAALKNGMAQDPDADYGYYLNADGTLRTSDVWVVGYSWGSQTWAMISSYVRFGRVICTSGPQAEQFPKADWILKPGPNATPGDRKYTLLGFEIPYPALTGIDAAPNNVMSMIDTTTKAGWGAGAAVINVRPGDPGPFAPGHQIAMVGSATNTPGGHTIFCTGDPKNGWTALCKYVFAIP